MSGPFENDSITADDHWDYPSAAEDRASYRYSYSKTCKHCGKNGLHWIWVGAKQGWRLGSAGVIHECKPKSLAPKKPSSSKVYDLLSYSIEGLHMSQHNSEEYDKLMKYFKDNGLTVDDLLKTR